MKSIMTFGGRQRFALAMLSWLSLSPVAQAGDADLTVFLHQEAVGKLTDDPEGDATRVTYQWNSNGRGPNVSELIRVDTNNVPTRWSVAGAAMMGGKVEERFEWKNGKATWRNQSQSDSRKLKAVQLYVPDDASPWSFGAFARALLKAPGHQLNVLPVGTLKLTNVRQITLGEGSKAVPLQIYRIDGLDLQPTYVALDAKERMFAWFPQTSNLGMGVRTGYEALRPQIQQLESQLEQERIEKITQAASSRYTTPVRFRNVRVFDPRSGQLSAASTVVVMGERIVRVMPLSEEIAAEATDEVVIDGAGGTLMPGLHDMHGHVITDAGLFWIAAGITTVREMGNYNELLARLQPLMDDGTLAGPHLVPSGIIEGHSQYALNMGFKPNSEAEALSNVRWYADHGYSMVKVYSSFNPQWVRPLADEAHRLGLKVGGHIPAFTNADAMIDAGYDSITHLNLLLFNWLLPESADTRTLLRVTGIKKAAELDLASPGVQKTLEAMRTKQVSMDPTLSIIERLILSRSGQLQEGVLDYVDHLPATFKRRRMRTGVSLAEPGDDQAYRRAFDKSLALIRLMHEKGIRLLPGTDDTSGFLLHRELELYVKAGISNARVLKLATSDAQDYLYASPQAGVVERGKVADLMLIAGDPLKDIKAIKQPRLVMKGGVLYRPEVIYRELNIQPFATTPDIKLPAAQ